jgi:hypothetical protein
LRELDNVAHNERGAHIVPRDEVLVRLVHHHPSNVTQRSKGYRASLCTNVLDVYRGVCVPVGLGEASERAPGDKDAIPFSDCASGDGWWRCASMSSSWLCDRSMVFGNVQRA